MRKLQMVKCKMIRSGPRRAALALAALLVATLALSAGRTASGQDLIVIYGANSGSHLRLTVNDGSIVVHGYKAATQPVGCRFPHNRNAAVCPLDGVGSILLKMGPSRDEVDVLDGLPVPLTPYLGHGSDRFIGSGEPDTCYSQGSRRNRCIGGGGNDICITGQQNSDCVGGAGNDYAKHGAGSDGCWGGPGNDICLMGPGKDGAHGGPSPDKLDGQSGDDKLYGQEEDDKLFGGSGNDKLFGGPGDDMLDAGSGSNKLYGGVGNDVLYGPGVGKAGGLLGGGPGHDTCYGVFGRDGFRSCETKVNTAKP